MSGTNLILIAFLVVPVAAGALLAVVVRRHRVRASVPLLVAGNLFAFVCFAGAAMALGEIYYRFVYDESDALQVSLAGRRWTERHYRHNNFGVRDNLDYEFAITGEGRRLTILGDSFANGHGIADVEDRYANLLRSALDGWEVHVLARDGLDAGGILDEIGSRLSGGYEIDCVLYAMMINDVADLIPEWQAVADRIYAGRPGFLVENSYLINTFYHRQSLGSDPGLAGYLDTVAAGYEGQVWERQRARLSALDRTVKQAGGRLVVVSFPFLQALDSPRFDAIHAQLASFWQGLGVPHLDLLEVFRGSEDRDWTVSRYDPHPNERAHRLAAETIAPFVLQRCGTR